MAIESVTITACGNATPPAGTCVAGFKTSASLFLQAIILGDTNGNQFGIGAASPVFSTIVNQAGSAAGSPLFFSVTNLSGSAAGSPLFVVANNLSGSAAGSPTFVSVANLAGSAAGSPLFVTQNNMSGSVAGSPMFVSVTNLAGSAAGSPLFVSACLTNLSGSAAGSPLFTSITNLAGSAAGSPLFASACITNIAGSAAGSPLFTSITNLAGSAAGSPLFSSITNLAGSAAGSPLFVRVGDGTDTAFVDTASRLAVTVTDGSNAYGPAGSPLSQTGQGQTMYWAGSLLTIQQVNLSSSISGCTPIIASLNGFANVIVNATFTTSSCQFIGWTACGNSGAASATVQTRMPFGTNGGMDAKRSPDSYLWAFPSGSIAVLTTTSACVVAGTINYIQVAS